MSQRQESLESEGEREVELENSLDVKLARRSSSCRSYLVI